MKHALKVALAAAIILAASIAPAAAGQTIAQSMAGANYKEAQGNVYSWAGFPAPCTVPTQALILLEKQGPAEVIVGDTFTYFIQISNRSTQDMISVTLEDVLPEGFTLQSIDPKPQKEEKGKLFWNVGTIPAQTTKRITVTGRADKVGCLASASLARICYEIPLPLAVRVVQCNVDIKQALPEVTDLCDPITMVLTVFNVGSAPAQNTCVTDTLPDGLTTADGQTSFSIPVGTLPVGGQQSFKVMLKANKLGVFKNTAKVTADRDCAGTSTASVKVVSGDLQLAASAPAEGFICTDIPYRINVINKGNGPAYDVQVVHGLGGEFQITNISDNGKFGASRVVWKLGTIQPGETKSVSLVGMSDYEGTVLSNFSVSGRCLKTKTASHSIDLKGVSGVLTSVQDDCDPVQVGGTVTYTITASNTGSRNDHDLRYVVELDEGMEYVSGAGASQITKSGEKTLTFAPLDVLPKGKTAIWQITVRAKTPGDKRFTTKLTTRQLKTPVIKAESTNFYKPDMKMVIAK